MTNEHAVAEPGVRATPLATGNGRVHRAAESAPFLARGGFRIERTTLDTAIFEAVP